MIAVCLTVNSTQAFSLLRHPTTALALFFRIVIEIRRLKRTMSVCDYDYFSFYLHCVSFCSVFSYIIYNIRLEANQPSVSACSLFGHELCSTMPNRFSFFVDLNLHRDAYAISHTSHNSISELERKHTKNSNNKTQHKWQQIIEDMNFEFIAPTIVCRSRA